MKQSLLAGPFLITCILSGSALALAQESAQTVKLANRPVAEAKIVIPKSSVPAASNGTTLKTIQAHTHTQLYMPAGWKPDEVAPPHPDELPPFPGYAYETPASLACIYSLVTTVPGCNPNTVTTNASGGSRAIAIVDAFDDPTAGPDLAYFSAQFGLPFSPAQLQVVYEDGSFAPPHDPTGGWEFEESTDIEYAHAMAPNATIYLVETDSNYLSDLLTGVEIASNLVNCGNPDSCPIGSKGKGEVSMSWGGPEFAEETGLDFVFTTPGVVYFAAAGDTAGEPTGHASLRMSCARAERHFVAIPIAVTSFRNAAGAGFWRCQPLRTDSLLPEFDQRHSRTCPRGAGCFSRLESRYRGLGLGQQRSRRGERRLVHRWRHKPGDSHLGWNH